MLNFLDVDATGLDLRDAEDRAIFRARVAHTLRATRVDAMRELVDTVARDRNTITRAIADAYIARNVA